MPLSQSRRGRSSNTFLPWVLRSSSTSEQHAVDRRLDLGCRVLGDLAVVDGDGEALGLDQRAVDVGEFFAKAFGGALDRLRGGRAGLVLDARGPPRPGDVEAVAAGVDQLVEADQPLARRRGRGR